LPPFHYNTEINFLQHKGLAAMARFILSFTLVALLASTSAADPGKPVAVRWWGQGMVSIETDWNQTVVIDPYNDKIGYTVPDIDGDLVLVTHEHFDHNNVEAVGGDPDIVRGLSPDGQARAISGVLDRRPNTPSPNWSESGGYDNLGHPILIRSIPAWHDDEQGAKRGVVAMFVINVDGVRIVHCSDLGQTQLTDAQLESLGKVDVLCLPVGGVYTIDGEQAVAIIDQIKPRIVLPIHYKTEVLAIGLDRLEPFIKALGDKYKVKKVQGNTLAVATFYGQQPETRVVVLNYRPWKPTGELAELFDKMDSACRDSQKVFASFSANQMNFRPLNGTHTPRWNAEHMMGRQLLFFSQIYAAKDPAIQPIDLNPAQMPPDYKAAHSDWDGAEEARQMERVGAFVRRFAYLLDGVDLDVPAPGSRWTLRRLLKQMDRHFDKHTKNVKKKLELHEWPTE
jgi:L-ascorbate metabolism protein UlaG (beta-lactamase superfamily)